MLNEAFEVHDTLNPALWENDKLKLEVKNRILDIVDLFIEQMDIPFKPVDIVIVGSNASFNYNDTSDVDVHLVANFNNNQSKELLVAYYNLERNKFNSNYDISIHGVEIEVYVEDIETGAVSNGIYSVLNDEWIKYPKPIQVKVYDIDKEVSELKQMAEDALNSNSTEDISNAIDKLYLLRKNSIANEGEYGKGNQIFKEIRSLGLLDELKEKLKQAISKDLTLEQLEYKLETSSLTDLLEMDI